MASLPELHTNKHVITMSLRLLQRPLLSKGGLRFSVFELLVHLHLLLVVVELPPEDAAHVALICSFATGYRQALQDVANHVVSSKPLQDVARHLVVQDVANHEALQDVALQKLIASILHMGAPVAANPCSAATLNFCTSFLALSSLLSTRVSATLYVHGKGKCRWR